MLADSFARLASALERNTPAAAGLEPRLHAALTQIVAHPGKLLRAQLVLAAGERHGLRAKSAEDLACAIEFFHAASLVLDDLPCMDDALTRRGLPCVHRQHGEATAILAALALINRAYSLVGRALAAQPQRVRSAVNAALDRALGVPGLVGGQAWDLAFARTDRSARTVSRIAAAKTGALFTLAVLVPAELARPSGEERRALRSLCVCWGQQFQIADDLRDVLSTSVDAGKSTGRDRLLTRPNLALALGVPTARARLERLSAQCVRSIERLSATAEARWDYLREFNRTMASAVSLADSPQNAAA